MLKMPKMGDAIMPDLGDSNPTEKHKNASFAAHPLTRKQPQAAAAAAAQFSNASASSPSAGGPGRGASEIRRMLAQQNELAAEIRANLTQQKRPASEISSITTMPTALSGKEKEGADRMEIPNLEMPKIQMPAIPGISPVWMHACGSVYVSVYLCVYTGTCMYVHIHTCIYTCICMTYIHVCIHIRAYVCIYTQPPRESKGLDVDEIALEESHKEAEAERIDEAKNAMRKSLVEAQRGRMSTPSEISNTVTSPAALRGDEQEGCGQSKDEGDIRRLRVFGSKFGVHGHELDQEATKRDKAMAVVSFLKDLGQRLVFIIPALMKGRRDNTLYLYLFDLALLFFFWLKQRYCPGSLYNHLHVLLKGKKLKPMFVSIRSRRFSGTKKAIVGVSAIASVAQVVRSVADIWCFFNSETPWKKRPKDDIVYMCIEAAGVVLGALKTLVAVVATVIFWGFAIITYFRFILSAILAYLMCKARSNLSTQQARQRAGVDQRNMFQKVGGIFSSEYSRDAVNQRNVESAQWAVNRLSAPEGGKQFMGFSIPDLGSNAGTCMYNFWALIWESL